MPRLPSPENVPSKVRQAGGSGGILRAPAAPVDTGELGETITGIGSNLLRGEDRVRKSDESFRRSTAVTEFEEETANELRELGLSGDLSNAEQSAAFGNSMTARIGELQSRLGGGSENHQNRFNARLETSRARFADKAAIMAADIRKKKTGALIGQDLNRLTDQMNDGSLSIDDAFGRLDEIIDDQADSMSVPDEIAFRQSGRSLLVASRFENFMSNGAIEDAESLLEEPGVAAVLSPELQTQLDRRITEAKREAGKLTVLSTGQILVDRSGRRIAQGPEKQQKGFTLKPGETRFDFEGEKVASVLAEEKTFTLRPGERVVDTDGKTIVEATNRPITHILSPEQIVVDEKGNPIAEGTKVKERLVEIGDETSPTGSRFVKESEAEGKPGRPRKPQVEIKNLGEDAFLKRLGEKDADRVDSLETQAALAQENLTDITRLRAATKSGKFTTGLFANTRQIIARFAALLEIPGGEISKLIGDAATADTLDSASARLAIQTVQQGGRITNLFITTIKDSLPSLTRTPEGNLILIDVMERLEERKIEMAALAESFVQEHETLRPKGVPTYFDAIRKLEKDDPVITPEILNRIKSASKSAPKSFKELVGDVVGDGEGIPVPAALADKPDKTRIRQKSTGQLFEKRGDRMFPVE